MNGGVVGHQPLDQGFIGEWAALQCFTDVLGIYRLKEISGKLHVGNDTLFYLIVDNERAAEWIKKGAQPTDTVRGLLKKSGAID